MTYKNNWYGYNPQQDEDESQQQQLQIQKQKSLHQMKLLLGNFHYMLEPLEEYVEKAGYYPNFRNKRQLYRKSIKDSEGPLWNDEDLFLTQLFVFAAAAHGKPQFFREVVREEFYKWINHTGITAENCPEKLKHFLIEINNILDGNDEKILRETRERNKNVEIDPKAVVGIFSSIHQPLNRNREQRKVLEGKSWNELGDEDKFEGDADLGKQTFEQIKLSVSIPHERFMLRKSEADTLQQIDALIEERNSGMEGVESSSSTSTQQYSKSDLKEIQANADKSNKDNKVVTIATISIFTALVIGGVILVARNKLKKVKK